MSFSINIKHGLSSHMLGITKWYLKRCVLWLQGKQHKKTSHHAGIQHVGKRWGGYSQRLQLSPLPMEDTQHLTGLGELVVALNICLEVFLTLHYILKLELFLMVVSVVGCADNWISTLLLWYVWSSCVICQHLPCSGASCGPRVHHEYGDNERVWKTFSG